MSVSSRIPDRLTGHARPWLPHRDSPADGATVLDVRLGSRQTWGLVTTTRWYCRSRLANDFGIFVGGAMPSRV